AAWVAAEFGRVQLLTGNPWALAGYSQVGMTPLVQVADVTGVYGVTFTLLAVNGALAELWLARRSRGPERRRVIAGLASAVGVVAMVVGYGFARLATPARVTASSGSCLSPNTARWRASTSCAAASRACASSRPASRRRRYPPRQARRA